MSTAKGATTSGTTAEGRTSRRPQLLTAAAIVVLALNLRPAAVSIAPVLADIRAGLGMSSTTAGVLTTLPVLCFAGFGLAAPWCARRVGMHRFMLVTLVVAGCGLVLRSVVTSPVAFLAVTVPVLAGLATANVLLPSLVKLHFPQRIGLLTALYTTALAIGLTAASVLTVPVADVTGGWRGGLAVWGTVAVVSAVPWLWLVRHDVKSSGTVSRLSLRSVARTPLGWWMAAFFGLQSLQAYAVFGWLPEVFRFYGYPAQTAGLLLGITTAIGIPISLALPGLAVRLANQTPFVLGLCGCYVVGFLGLLTFPEQFPWLWALLIGAGTGLFPLTLTLIGLRARTSDGTAALSGFAQSVGYLIGAAGPFMMGALFDFTGAWTVPLLVLLSFVAPLAVAGVKASRPAYLEDQLAAGMMPA